MRPKYKMTVKMFLVYVLCLLTAAGCAGCDGVMVLGFPPFYTFFFLWMFVILPLCLPATLAEILL